MKHRFGTQEKSSVSKSLVISMIGFLAAVFIFWEATGFVTDRTDQEEVRILERAVNRGIVHCYTIEGAYPENLQYLKDNYGLTYDEDRFFVDYQVLGSNILPNVTIIDRRNRP